MGTNGCEIRKKHSLWAAAGDENFGGFKRFHARFYYTTCQIRVRLRLSNAARCSHATQPEILANSVVETRNEMDIRNNSVKSPRRLLGAVHSAITAPRSWSLQQRFSGFRQTRTGSLGTKESRPRGHHAPVDSPSLSRSRGAAPRAHFGHRVHGLQSILPGELLPMHLHFPALTLPLTVSAQLLQT